MVKKYTTIIKPVFDKESVEKMKKQLESVGKIGRQLNTMRNIAIQASIIGLWWAKTNEYIEKANGSIQDFLGYTDRLGTLAGDLPNITAGELAYTGQAMSVMGVGVEDQDKLFKNLQDAIAGGQLVKREDQSLTSILSGLQANWQKGNEKERADIEALVGLRGKKASEFLQGDIYNEVAKLEKLTGISKQQIDVAVKKGSELEEKQAREKAKTELVNLVNVGQNLDGGVIDAQANLQRIRNNDIANFLKTYESQVNTQLAKDRAMYLLIKVVDNAIRPLIDRVGGIANIDKLSLGGLAIEGAKAVLLGIKDVFIGIIKETWQSIWRPSRPQPKTETEKKGSGTTKKYFDTSEIGG